MDYNKLTELTNTYPQHGNYIKTQTDEVTLYGVYDSINKIEFTTEDLNRLKVVNDTSFKFILGIKLGDRPEQLYTSKVYYDTMFTAKKEPNPYFINYSFKDVFIIRYKLDSVTFDKFEKMVSEEEPVGVKMSKNNFINYDGSAANVDYEQLVKYIDWVVAKPKLEDVDTDNVIPADKLGKWELEEIKFDYENQDVSDLTSGGSSSTPSTGGGGGTGSTPTPGGNNPSQPTPKKIPFK